MHKDKTGVLHDAGNCKQCEEEDMKRYLVTWTELHSQVVEASDEETAVDNAYWFDAKDSTDNHELIAVEEMKPDDMDVAKHENG